MNECRTIFLQIKAAYFVCTIIYVLILTLALTMNSKLRQFVLYDSKKELMKY